MSFTSDLRSELARNGIRGGLANRIVVELEDHLACDPGANVGAPAELAARFAAELRITRTRRATVGAFAALALLAVFLFVVGSIGSRTGGFTGATRTAAPISGLAVFAFAQIAFVAGVLAVARGFRGRGAGDMRLAQRRALIALAAGCGVSVALAVSAVSVGPMSVWWHVFGVVCALVPLLGLFVAARAVRHATALTPSEPAAGLEADLPFSPRVLLVALGAIAVAFVVAQGVVGERSASEGLIRGAIEAAGLALGVVLLGRPLGLLSSAR